MENDIAPTWGIPHFVINTDSGCDQKAMGPTANPFRLPSRSSFVDSVSFTPYNRALQPRDCRPPGSLGRRLASTWRKAKAQNRPNTPIGSHVPDGRRPVPPGGLGEAAGACQPPSEREPFREKISRDGRARPFRGADSPGHGRGASRGSNQLLQRAAVRRPAPVTIILPQERMSSPALTNWPVPGTALLFVFTLDMVHPPGLHEAQQISTCDQADVRPQVNCSFSQLVMQGLMLRESG